MMTNAAGYREANALETRLYWEKSDALNNLYTLALQNKDRAAMVHFRYQKKATYELFTAIGYRVDQTGIYMREEEDILNGPYNEHLDRAADIGWRQLLRLMQVGQ